MPVKSIRLLAKVEPIPDGRQEVTSAFFTGDLNAGQLTNFAGIAMLIRQLLVFFNAADQGFHLTITSALPSERGMGSSAATAVAVVRAFYDAFQNVAQPFGFAKLGRDLGKSFARQPQRLGCGYG